MPHGRAAISRTLAVLIFILTLYCTGLAQGAAQAQADSLAAQVDALMTPYSRGESPGAAVLVIRDGRVLLKKGYGFANLETKETITPDTVFDLESVSKQFTAMAVLMLAERGKLSLDDALSKFFPQFPPYARAVTIRNLLQHTSGIQDYPNLLVASGKLDPNWLRSLSPSAYQPTSADIIELVAAQKEPEFAAGQKENYNNAGYIILAQVVAKVSGKSFARFMKENIFQPLGMNSTFIYDETKPKASGLAQRYERDGKGFRAIHDVPFDLSYGDHGVYSTLNDLQKWDAALYTERLVKATLLKQAFVPARLNDGSTTDYGFGCVIDKYFGLNMFYHQGGGTGYSTFIMRIPSERYTVVVLSNFHRLNPFITGRKVTRLYLADKLSLPVAVKLAPEVLQQYVGTYQLAPLVNAVVTLDGQRLRSQVFGQPAMTLLPLSDNKFFVEGQEDVIITFNRDAKGQVESVTVLEVDIPRTGKRIETPAPKQ